MEQSKRCARRKNLTKKQERFARHIAMGKSPDEAYRLVYSVQHLGYLALVKNARRLLNQEHIAARIAELQEEKARGADGGAIGSRSTGGDEPAVKSEEKKAHDGQEKEEMQQVSRVLPGVVYTDEVTMQEVLNGLREVKDKCLGNLPVRTDEKGKTQTWVFHPAGANRALELLGKHVGLFEKQESGEDELLKVDQILCSMDKMAKSDL
jgi:hypothetical protein